MTCLQPPVLHYMTWGKVGPESDDKATNASSDLIVQDTCRGAIPQTQQ
jgi:hypothetical protein